jgi:hypothetical protein
MIQDLILTLQSSLKNYSQSLANQNLLVDVPWTMIDGDLNLQRLIFKKDNSLYIVKEGEIQESKWEYLAAMNSIVIEVGGKKILLNEVFADKKALILKKDGNNQEFLSFINEKELPDLNLIGHLKSISFQPEKNEDEIKQNIQYYAKKIDHQDILALIITIFIVIIITIFGISNL